MKSNRCKKLHGDWRNTYFKIRCLGWCSGLFSNVHQNLSGGFRLFAGNYALGPTLCVGNFDSGEGHHNLRCFSYKIFDSSEQ